MKLEDMGSVWVQHLRLALLRALASPDECRGGKGHESLLTDLVNGVHIAADREQVRAELLWLHEKGLVAVDAVQGAVVATITPDGAEVAAGRKVFAGVKQPNMASALKSVAELLAADLKPLRPNRG